MILRDLWRDTAYMIQIADHGMLLVVNRIGLIGQVLNKTSIFEIGMEEEEGVKDIRGLHVLLVCTKKILSLII
jgi:hypothetical protein